MEELVVENTKLKFQPPSCSNKLNHKKSHKKKKRMMSGKLRKKSMKMKIGLIRMKVMIMRMMMRMKVKLNVEVSLWCQCLLKKISKKQIVQINIIQLRFQVQMQVWWCNIEGTYVSVTFWEESQKRIWGLE